MPNLARLLAISTLLSSQASAQDAGFTRQVEPILAEKCYVCHGPVQQMGGLRLDRKQSRSRVAGTGTDGRSELLRRITSQDPSVRMPPWPPALQLSANDIELLTAWVSKGALGEDTNKSTSEIEALFRAVDMGETVNLRALLKNRELLEVRDGNGATLLMRAALNASPDCVKYLLDSGAEPNARNNDGATALIWAANDAGKVRLLLAAGADVNVKTRHGGTALLAASTPYNSYEVVAQLLAKGAQVDTPSADGWTPLAKAASAGNVRTIDLLLAKGANPNAPSTALNSLNAAVWYGNLNAVRLLLRRGADVEAKDGLGLTALALAAIWDRKEIAKFLMQAGARVDAVNPEPTYLRRMAGTPLMLAAYAEPQDPALIKALIAHGADVNFSTPDHQTALERARAKGETPVVAALLAAGAKSDSAGGGNNTARLPRTRFPDTRTAIERSLALLQRSDRSFLNKTGCKSCHNQSLPAMALAMADERGLQFDKPLAKQQSDSVLLVMNSQREKMLEMMDDEGPPLSGGYALAGLAAQQYPANATTDAFVRNIAARQLVDGRWHPAGTRPPLEYSDVSPTAFAILAMRTYGAGRAVAGYEARINKARIWLTSFQPRYTEERVFQLLGLNWAKSDNRLLRKLSDALKAQQKQDGGWAQLPTLPSDAYATGQVLWALYQARTLKTTDPTFQKGVQFLRDTQLDDGSWFVKTHALAVQPYLDSEFPHGENQFISVAATSWATMALLIGEPIKATNR